MECQENAYLDLSRCGGDIWRRREIDKWELECVSMLKAMPHQLLLRHDIVNDLKANRVSEGMVTLLRRGVILEIPEHFM